MDETMFVPISMDVFAVTYVSTRFARRHIVRYSRRVWMLFWMVSLVLWLNRLFL